MKNKIKRGEQGGEVVGLCCCCCHSRYHRSRCSRCCCHSHCHLPLPPVPAGGGGVVVAQCLRSCSFALVLLFVWAAPIRAHWPSFVLVAARSCSLLLIRSRLCLFAGPCLFVPARLYWLALVLIAARLHSFAGPHSCLAFTCARSCLFGFVCAHLGSFVLVRLLFALIRAWLGLFGLVRAHLRFDGFLFGLPSLSFVSVSNIWLVHT
jgi:hypothetical protein